MDNLLVAIAAIFTRLRGNKQHSCEQYPQQVAKNDNLSIIIYENDDKHWYWKDELYCEDNISVVEHVGKYQYWYGYLRRID